MKILKNILPVLLLFSFASSFGCCGSGHCGSVSEKEKAAIKKKYKEIYSINVKDKYDFYHVSRDGKFFFGKNRKNKFLEIRNISDFSLFFKFVCPYKVFDCILSEDCRYIFVSIDLTQSSESNVKSGFAIFDKKKDKLIFVDTNFLISDIIFSPNKRYVCLMSCGTNIEGVEVIDYKIFDLKSKKIVKEYKDCLDVVGCCCSGCDKHVIIVKKINDKQNEMVLLDVDQVKEIGKMVVADRKSGFAIKNILKKIECKDCKIYDPCYEDSDEESTDSESEDKEGCNSCCCCGGCCFVYKILSDLEKIHSFEDCHFYYDDKDKYISLITKDGKLVVLKDKKNTMQYKDKIERAVFLAENYL